MPGADSVGRVLVRADGAPDSHPIGSLDRFSRPPKKMSFAERPSSDGAAPAAAAVLGRFQPGDDGVFASGMSFVLSLPEMAST